MANRDMDTVPLTAFPPALADAVVAVLSEGGIPAWQDDDRDAFGDVVVLVPQSRRDEAMEAMGRNMERIATRARGAPRPADAAGEGGPGATVSAERARPRDPDDAGDGPPLTMERFADLRVLVIALLAPLLVVTIAGPFLSRQARTVTFTVILIGLAVVLWRRRSR